MCCFIVLNEWINYVDEAPVFPRVRVLHRCRSSRCMYRWSHEAYEPVTAAGYQLHLLQVLCSACNEQLFYQHHTEQQDEVMLYDTSVQCESHPSHMSADTVTGHCHCLCSACHCPCSAAVFTKLVDLQTKHTVTAQYKFLCKLPHITVDILLQC